MSIFKDTLVSIWNDVLYYLTLQFVDSFWWYLAFVVIAFVVITAAEIAIRFYFADVPWLRKVGGLAIIGMILMLFAYRRGEKDARTHDAKAKPRPQAGDGYRWKFPWDQ